LRGKFLSCSCGDSAIYGGGFLRAAAENTYLSLLNIFLMKASIYLELGSQNIIGILSLFELFCMEDN